jgi:hypothetical protein
LLARGHHFITDDVLAVSLDHRLGPVVHAGSPQLRLWPEAATSLGNDVERLPRLHPAIEKRAVVVPAADGRGPLPLGQIYLLAEGPTREVERLSPQDAFRQLMQHAQCLHAGSTRYIQRHISTCIALADRVAIHRLFRPLALDELDDLAGFVEARHLAS